MKLNLPDAATLAELTLSIVIPVHNGGENFRNCLASLAQFATAAIEIIVVDDGSTDESWKLAQAMGAKVLRNPVSAGPATARNLGAKAASGDILFFVDADVTIGKNTLEQVLAAFHNQPDLAALIGSYDDTPGASNFLSQFKNLFHHYTHQTASEEATTFWGACGAIRRQIFLELGGFDESYRYPSIEDIELGYRLKGAGYRIQLCKTLQVKHLKQWRVFSLLRADFFYRAIPWTELIWRDRHLVNDLNLTLTSRISTLLVYGLLLMCWLATTSSEALILAGLLGLMLLLLNRHVYQFFHRKRGALFAIKTIPWHWLYFFYSGLAFAIGSVRYSFKLQHAFKLHSGKASLS